MDFEKIKQKFPFRNNIPCLFQVYIEEVVYILISIHINVSISMDSGNCVCKVLDYNTGTWWRCDDCTIKNYSRYPENLYDDLSPRNEKKGEIYYECIRYDCVTVMHKRGILASITYSFCTRGI